MHRTILPELPEGEDASGVEDAADMAPYQRNRNRAERLSSLVKAFNTRRTYRAQMQRVPAHIRKGRSAPTALRAGLVRHARHDLRAKHVPHVQPA